MRLAKFVINSTTPHQKLDKKMLAIFLNKKIVHDTFYFFQIAGEKYTGTFVEWNFF